MAVNEASVPDHNRGAHTIRQFTLTHGIWLPLQILARVVSVSDGELQLNLSRNPNSHQVTIS